VAEYGNFDLACVNAFFENKPFVVAKRVVDRCAKFSTHGHFRHTNG